MEPGQSPFLIKGEGVYARQYKIKNKKKHTKNGRKGDGFIYNVTRDKE